jgi:hypothetical protein
VAKIPGSGGTIKGGPGSRPPYIGSGAGPAVVIGGSGVQFTPGFGGSYSPSGVPLFLSYGGSMRLIVPPGGFAGVAQQTDATKALFARATGRRGGRATQRKRRRKAKATRSAPKRRKRTGKLKRLVKGSAAAKRHMAKIRRKRRR